MARYGFLVLALLIGLGGLYAHASWSDSTEPASGVCLVLFPHIAATRLPLLLRIL
jgi:hypothetical protein